MVRREAQQVKRRLGFRAGRTLQGRRLARASGSSRGRHGAATLGDLGEGAGKHRRGDGGLRHRQPGEPLPARQADDDQVSAGPDFD